MWYTSICVFVIILQWNNAVGMIKVWTENSFVSNPRNWEGGKYSKGCKGVIMPEQSKAPLIMDRLSTSQIILPTNGVVEIWDEIEINPWSTKCIRMREMNYIQWLTPDYWLLYHYDRQNDSKPSMPHVERVPCHSDIVAFSALHPFAIELPPVDVMILSVMFVELSDIPMYYIDNSDFHEFMYNTHLGRTLFSRNDSYPVISVDINPKGNCKQKQGCFCHKMDDDYIIIEKTVCENLKEPEHPTNCLFPIRPIGHCRDICGGTVLLEHDADFKFNDVQDTILPDDYVDSYMSNVLIDEKTYSQIVFREKESEYNELSSQKAKEFYESIIENQSKFGIKSVRIELSGEYYLRKSYIGHSFSIFFGTLLAAVIFFVIIFALFMGPQRFTISNVRIPWLDNGKGNYHYQQETTTDEGRPFMFARFENKDEGRLSLAPSVVSLDKTFENPLFGKEIQPSASASCATLDPITEKDLGDSGVERSTFELQLTSAKNVDLNEADNKV
ncbi:protein amnionless [Agrilus planipennis]|uniref:Protein amnionless n=1 Tax=Agrilus planipennis TaxID=224129 RepID=A0A1W4WTS3_AGRPL|nr:protein amnionless [Agrilus planipennis]